MASTQHPMPVQTLQHCPRCKNQHISIKRLCVECLAFTRSSIEKALLKESTTKVNLVENDLQKPLYAETPFTETIAKPGTISKLFNICTPQSEETRSSEVWKENVQEEILLSSDDEFEIIVESNLPVAKASTSCSDVIDLACVTPHPKKSSSYFETCPTIQNIAVQSTGFSFASDSTKQDINNVSSKVSTVLPTSLKQESSLNNPSYSCVVCGKSLRHINSVQGRLNHLKRCSKKNNLQAKDVKEHDDLLDLTHFKSAQHHDWHGKASEELDLACASATDPAMPTSTQSKLTTFFQKPIKSVNKVLLAGAKRLAKRDEIVANPPTKIQRRGSAPISKKTSYTKTSCPAYKRISGTDFIVDGFHHANPALSRKYFLTHFHSDHYGGISSSWNAGTIYCSLSTANLVHQQLGVDKLYLHPLPLLTPTVIESMAKPITVTLMDANHCPGAVMMLFQVGPKYILHVGDFRWDRQKMLPLAPLRTFISGRTRLHELYFDTTYCNEKYAGVPTQEAAIQATKAVVDRELDESRRNGKNTLFLFGSYTIGKERVYMSVCEHLQTKAFADNQRFKILSCLDWTPELKQLLTTDQSSTNIWVVPLGHINFKRMNLYLNEQSKKPFTKHYDRVVGFRPTGWSYSDKSNDIVSSRKSGENVVYGVPYSEHSNYNELVDCLLTLKPHKIIPTVSASKSQEQVELLLSSVRHRQQS